MTMLQQHVGDVVDQATPLEAAWSTYAAVRDYALNPAYIDETVDVGDGVDMRDPTHPKAVSGRPFASPVSVAAEAQETVRSGLEPQKAAIQDSFYFKTAESDEEEERIIAMNFKASYGLSSVSAAGLVARKERLSFHTTYALLEHVGEFRTLPRGIGRQWEAPPLQDAGLTGADLREHFHDVYGTHFVSQTRYGLRVAIQARMSKQEKHTQEELQATFKAALTGAGAQGSLSAQHKQALLDMNVEVKSETSSGGLVGKGLPSTILDIDGVDDYLRQLRDGVISYAVAPISMSLKSYLPTLHPSWDIYQALKRTAPATPELEYGVPLGTVVPWCPPSTHVVGLDPAGTHGKTRVTPPFGWAICDGTAGTPDLRDRFVLGVGSEGWPGAPVLGGSRNPLTGETSGGPVGEALPAGGGTKFHPSNYGHTHTVTIPAPDLPPFVGLVYLMRVA